MTPTWCIAVDHGRWQPPGPRPVIAPNPLPWHSTRYAGETLASVAQKYPCLVRPRPGSSTGTTVSSAKIRVEASNISRSLATTGATSAAAYPPLAFPSASPLEPLASVAHPKR